ncbi:MAG: hypothetical protein K2H21_10080, partial [Muribaculaceae bacterium]|nr:hypothetical protein [Muribaculaceae bacterium]
ERGGGFVIGFVIRLMPGVLKNGQELLTLQADCRERGAPEWCIQFAGRYAVGAVTLSAEG